MNEYELIDSGEGEKLERFGNFVLSRPDPQALWRKRLDKKEWKKADAVFVRGATEGEWRYKNNIKLEKWSINFGGLKFFIKPTAFKHTGLFPEQSVNWDWMRGIIKSANVVVSSDPAKLVSEIAKSQSSLATAHSSTKQFLRHSDSPRVFGNSTFADLEVLNLFGYTGGATLACAQAGAKVVHVDSSKSAITWARENAELSELSQKPTRWILEDARVFVRREVARGNKYDAVIMDPPAFGHGVNNEIWKIEENFLPLVEDCIKLLSDKPLFFIINGYSAGYSAIAYENVLKILVEKYGGKIEKGELTLEESVDSNSKDSKGRLLPCGIYARWSR
jgi:23S rRNA (cytosine1962-C5)-methyltransferase